MEENLTYFHFANSTSISPSTRNYSFGMGAGMSKSGSFLFNPRGVKGNWSEGIIIGATPKYYASWSLPSKVLVLFLILFVIVANSIVIALYHNLSRKVTTHELHVCHLAICDLLAGILSALPILSGHISHYVDTGKAMLIPCFIATLSTYACNVMATIICIIISYDRLRLLQLGIRYHMVATRMSGVIRLTIAWSSVVLVTVIISVLIIFTSIGQKQEECAYVLVSRVFIVKILMTLTALGPLTTLIVLNCLVRRKVKALEERHPHAKHRSNEALGKSQSAARSDTTGDLLETEVTTSHYLSSFTHGSIAAVSTTSNLFSALDDKQKRSGATTPSSTNGVVTPGRPVKVMSKKERSLSKRATTSIFLSTVTFILCLSPLTFLLMVEAWTPGTIRVSTDRWSLWFTLARTAVDPFLFARSVPSFRLLYGTTVIQLEKRWCWVLWLHRLLCWVPCWSDRSIIADAQERLDRKQRGSPAVMRIVETRSASNLASVTEGDTFVQHISDVARSSFNIIVSGVNHAPNRTIAVDGDQRIVLERRHNAGAREELSTEL